MAEKAAVNPFSFGDLALDDSFTDREQELRELTADVLNGQNVVIFAPRRYGKSSLVWRATQQLIAKRVLVAQVDLMTVATKEQLAAKLAQAIYEEIATPIFRVRERAAQVFRSLRIAPVMTVDPLDGSLGFSFRAGHAAEDVDATLEKLFQLPGGALGGAKAPCMPRLRRVPGGAGAGSQPSGADASRLPDAARRRPCLPREQAQHHARALQRRERAVLAEREADGARRDHARGLRSLHPRAVRGDGPQGRSGRRRRRPHDHPRAPVCDAGAVLRALGGDAVAPPCRHRRAGRGARPRAASGERALHADLGPGVARCREQCSRRWPPSRSSRRRARTSATAMAYRAARACSAHSTR